MIDESKGIGIGIDTMGYQDEPDAPERPPTTEEKIAAFDLRDCVYAANTTPHVLYGVSACDEIERDSDDARQVNYNLHLCWDAANDDYGDVVLRALERIVREAKRRWRLLP